MAQHHFVLADFGKLGIAFVETEPNTTLDSVVEDIASGEWSKVREVFEADEDDRTFRNVTETVAEKLALRQWENLSAPARELCERFETASGDDRDPSDDGLSERNFQRREAVSMGHFI